MTSPADKPTLREQLDAVRPDSDDLRDDGLQEAAQAIEESDQWREVFMRQQTFDRDLAAAVQEVEVPDGLKSQLLDSLAAARDERAADIPPTDPPAPLSRRSGLQWAATAAGLMLAVTLGWLLWPGDGSLITLEYARHELLPMTDGVIDVAELPAFDDSFEVALPDPAWIRHTQMQEELKGLDWTGDNQHDAAVYEFRVNGRVRIHGYLLVLPASRLSDPPTLTRLSRSGIDYRPVINTAWIDPTTGLVYICFVDRGDLDALQRVLSPHAA